MDHVFERILIIFTLSLPPAANNGKSFRTDAVVSVRAHVERVKETMVAILTTAEKSNHNVQYLYTLYIVSAVGTRTKCRHFFKHNRA